MLVFIIAVIVILAAALYLLYFYKINCSSKECFNDKLAECSRAVFIDESIDTAWQYDINGKSFMCLLSQNYCAECIINVKLLLIKAGSIDSAKLEGLGMVCSLPFGLVRNPQEDLSNCHGDLKEQIQDLMINRLHAYILSHVGEIGAELENKECWQNISTQTI